MRMAYHPLHRKELPVQPYRRAMPNASMHAQAPCIHTAVSLVQYRVGKAGALGKLPYGVVLLRRYLRFRVFSCGIDASLSCHQTPVSSREWRALSTSFTRSSKTSASSGTTFWRTTTTSSTGTTLSSTSRSRTWSAAFRQDMTRSPFICMIFEDYISLNLNKKVV